MKVNKVILIKTFAKHLMVKLNLNHSNVDQGVIVSSLLPAYQMYVPKMKSLGIIDDDDRIDLIKLRECLINFFNISPILNLPIMNSTLRITKEDVLRFLDDLDKQADIDQVIYLPCHN